MDHRADHSEEFDALPAPSPAAEPTSPFEPVLPCFCTRCGSPLDALSRLCPRCSVQESTPPRPERNLSSASLASAIALYFAILAVSVVGIAAILNGAAVVETEAAVLIIDSVLVVAWCVASRREIRPGLTIPRLRWFALAAGISIATFGIAMALLQFLHHALGLPLLDPLAPWRNSHGLGVTILAICVQPGIIEELAFRGVILGGLRRVLRDHEAVLVSAAMFMIIHLSVPSFPHLFLIGLALGYLRIRTRSLLPGMLAHFLHNLYCVLAG